MFSCLYKETLVPSCITQLKKSVNVGIWLYYSHNDCVYISHRIDTDDTACKQKYRWSFLLILVNGVFRWKVAIPFELNLILFYTSTDLNTNSFCDDALKNLILENYVHK